MKERFLLKEWLKERTLVLKEKKKLKEDDEILLDAYTRLINLITKDEEIIEKLKSNKENAKYLKLKDYFIKEDYNFEKHILGGFNIKYGYDGKMYETPKGFIESDMEFLKEYYVTAIHPSYKVIKNTITPILYVVLSKDLEEK